MRTILLSAVCFSVMLAATTAFGLTAEREIDAQYVQEHPGEFSVTVAKGKDGLVAFTVVHHVATPMYHVARLAVYQGGKLVATSDTPSFGRKRDNTFYFSLAADAVAESKFSLSDSALDSSGEVPLPGTIIYQFRLSDFVSKGLPDE